MNELYSHLEIPEKIISITTNETIEYEASIPINEIIYKSIRPMIKQSTN